MNQLGEKRPRSHGRKGKCYVRLLDPRDLENVVDQRQQILRLGLDFADRDFLRSGYLAEVTVGEHLERRQHRRERRLQIVHDHLHQVVADFLELAQLAQAVLERIRGRLELEQTPHARTKNQAIVRLGEEIVAPRLDAAHTVARVVERGHEDHRNAGCARVALDATAHLESRRAIIHTEVARRHRHVENA